jgi:hypothetical protein
MEAARAADDLQTPGSADVPASQAGARRALDRLAEALAGQAPADEKARDLARRQRDLAESAPKSVGDAVARRDLQNRQEKIAQETQGLKATEAPVRQGEATRATIQANVSLRDKPDEPETVDKMRTAAEKLEALADQLAGRESEVERADRLAKRQASTADKPPADPIDAKRQANEVASEAQQIRAGEQATAAKRDAVERLTRLQRSAPGTPENAQIQRDAAEALRRMADQMAQRRSDGDSAPSAEALARRQRDLAADTQTALATPESIRRLTEQQQQLRRQSSQLPTQQAPVSFQQARQAMDQAEQALSHRDTNEAARRQRQAADELDKASRQTAEAARQATTEANPPNGQPSPAQVDQARQMARRQRDLRDEVRRTTGEDTSTEAEKTVARRQQDGLAQQAGELARSLAESAAKTPANDSRQAAQDAASSARSGEQSMQKAQEGDAAQAAGARKAATEALNRAASQAERAAQGQKPSQSANDNPKAGQQIQNAQGQMGQAQNQLGQGRPKDAGDSMRRAAEALRDAARQMGQRGEPRGPREGAARPAEAAVQGTGTPTATDVPKDLEKYAGKKWGELPGDLQTRIVQDMKARYGDDYARVIKLYFEQIAENDKKAQNGKE